MTRPHTVTVGIDNPIDTVILIGAEVASSVQGSAAHLATITFERVASGMSTLGGRVVVTETGGGHLMGDKGRSFAAGHGNLAVTASGGGRRQLQQSVPRVSPFSRADWNNVIRPTVRARDGRTPETAIKVWNV